MKILVFLISMLFCFSGFSQVQNPAEDDTLKQKKIDYFQLHEPAKYKLNKQEFTFTPEMNRIHIKTIQDEAEVDFGDLRRTTDDGLYIMTSSINDDVSFGRFDSIGNFRTLRYDRKKDSVIEDWYIKGQLKDPE